MPMKKSKRERNSERKRERKLVPKDVTISDSADAPKVVSKLKKFTGVGPEIIKSEMTWDQMNSDSTDHEIVEEFNPDGTKSFVYKKKRNRSKSEASIDDRPGLVYPEIVWYHLSPYIKPEDVGHFAGINRSTYAITKTEKFWKGLYKQYCENRPRLPEKLRIENSYTVYGLRQRVIRALFHTYNLFFKRVMHEATQDSKPHDLVKRRCVNVWFSEGPTYWYVYFKFKKSFVTKTAGRWEVDFLEELGKVDANPEEDCQVLQVTCQSFYDVPPLMGMTLSSVSVVLSQGFQHHRVHLGFNSGTHNVSKNILPECTVVLDTVTKISVYNWWHPRYPHFDNTLPSNVRDEESLPVLKKDFFNITDGDYL
ncbi:putative transmembrane protein 183BP isoform X2 [Amyelois transitella]|uniref:putative transmembrane protein 183BP isoform X2 n=1 Tax=Amyelois transitella TaxID=680683 RepID=UPI00067D5307|nr:putative transmembrane protein 183BP isoform X2 [Amyelois transitella]